MERLATSNQGSNYSIMVWILEKKWSRYDLAGRVSKKNDVGIKRVSEKVMSVKPWGMLSVIKPYYEMEETEKF